MELRPIPGYEKYFVSDTGEVFSKKDDGKMRKLKPSDCGSKHRQVGLHDDKPGRKRMLVSCAVLTAFVSPRPKGMFACHGIKGSLDDSLDNVYWATPKQNSADKHRDGTHVCGEDIKTHKLNELQVRIIRRAYSWRGRNGLTAVQLSGIFGVHKDSVLFIVKRKTWTHI